MHIKIGNVCIIGQVVCFIVQHCVSRQYKHNLLCSSGLSLSSLLNSFT